MNPTPFDLTGKVAAVTGGGSGIGRAISLALARQGAHVGILEKSPEAGLAVRDEIHDAGGHATAYVCDVTNEAQVKTVVARLVEAHGAVHILINNAGIAHIGTIETTSEADLDRIYGVNVKGIFHCIRAVLPFMKAAGGGSIINIASVASLVGIADRFAYSMSKGAVLTMTYSVAKDYLAHGIRCNSVAPARVHTPFVDGYLKNTYPGREAEMLEALSRTQPIGRMGEPEEVAALVVYLASDEAAFITGTNFPIDGGFTTLNT